MKNLVFWEDSNSSDDDSENNSNNTYIYLKRLCHVTINTFLFWFSELSVLSAIKRVFASLKFGNNIFSFLLRTWRHCNWKLVAKTLTLSIWINRLQNFDVYAHIFTICIFSSYILLPSRFRPGSLVLYILKTFRKWLSGNHNDLESKETRRKLRSRKNNEVQ